jgi:hypothetical protein
MGGRLSVWGEPEETSDVEEEVDEMVEAHEDESAASDEARTEGKGQEVGYEETEEGVPDRAERQQGFGEEGEGGESSDDEGEDTSGGATAGSGSLWSAGDEGAAAHRAGGRRGGEESEGGRTSEGSGDSSEGGRCRAARGRSARPGNAARVPATRAAVGAKRMNAAAAAGRAAGVKPRAVTIEEAAAVDYAPLLPGDVAVMMPRAVATDACRPAAAARQLLVELPGSFDVVGDVGVVGRVEAGGAGGGGRGGRARIMVAAGKMLRSAAMEEGSGDDSEDDEEEGEGDEDERVEDDKAVVVPEQLDLKGGLVGDLVGPRGGQERGCVAHAHWPRQTAGFCGPARRLLRARSPAPPHLASVITPDQFMRV